jgi:hypothetical protein
MNVLVVCEYSATVRDAFRAIGHDAWSCDLLPCEGDGTWHIQGDALAAIASRQWDLVVAHPPCTYLSVSGLHWNKSVPGRAEKTEAGLAFVRAIFEARDASGALPRLALENPVSCISSRIRKPDQIIQPWQFGHDASKATCLWLRGVQPLQLGKAFPPRIVEWPRGSGKMRKRWGNQTDSGQNRLGPSEDRWKERSKTYEGIARAMAEQWGRLALAQEAA